MPSPALKARDDLIYYDQEIDGDDMVLVRDPIRGTYFRFNPLQAAMLRGLDGKRSAIEIVALLSEQYEVEIPPEAAERFIARARDLMLLDITAYDKTSARARVEVRKALDKAGFRTPMLHALPATTTPDGARFAAALRELERDHPRAAAVHLSAILDHDPTNAHARPLFDLIQTAYIKAAGATLPYPTWVLFNPGRMLTWLSRTFGWFIFSWLGVLAMIAVMCLGAYSYTQVSFDRVAFGPLEIAIAIVTLTVSNLSHEMGHGLACQHYGGDVTEIGLMMFYYVQPAAYCDTSSSYLISRRRHKVIIQLAGVTTSLLFISVQSMVLTVLHPSVIIYPGLVLELLLSSAFVFMTLIPLLKFDGYYAVSDYFDFSNLSERSYKLMWAWLSDKLLGIPMATEDLPRRTRFWLIAFAVSSLLFTTVFMYVAYTRLLNPVVERLRGPGLLLAVVLAIYLMRNMALRPLWGVARMIGRERRRIFTLRRTAVLIALATAVIGPWFVRWPVLIDAEFVALPAQRATVHATVGGRVDQVLVREGDRVHRDQPLAQLRDAALDARIAALDSDLAVAEARVALLSHGARAEQLAVARGRLGLARSEVVRNAATARVARDLAAADAGSRSDVDTTAVQVAAATGEAGDAQWGLALLEAGARPEAIAAAKAECARIHSQLDQARADHALLTLRSPIDGVVATPHLELQLQAWLGAGAAFADVHGTDRMVAEIALTPRDPLAELAVGDEVALRAYGDPHRAVTARVAQLRDATQDVAGEHRIIAVTAPFDDARAVSGVAGHARIYGADRSLAYANLWLPMQRLIRVKLWSMW